MRKLIIGLIAVGFIASLFWAYAKIMDAKPIEVRKEITGGDDLHIPEPSETVQQEGDADVRVAKEARYVVLDPETKEISRVFGFEKLLSQGTDTSRRQVQNPYMIFYDSDYQCRIDADMGMFQIETSGASSTPKDARLEGNVIIHVIPKLDSKISETIIEMDDLVFSSERSEFATDRKVYIKSEQVELRGIGLIVIFDSANGRIDFLRIRDLEEIRMQGLADSKSETKIAKEKTDTASPSPVPVSQADDTVASSEKAEEDQDKSPEPVRYYQCLLEDNVKIKHGNEIVVAAAEQVNIQNISFDQSTGIDGTPGKTENKPQKTKKSNKPSDGKIETTQDTEASSEVIITCDGGIILKPMQDENFEQASIAKSVLSVEKAPMPLQFAEIIPDSQQTPIIRAANLAGEKDAVAEPDTTGADIAASGFVSDPNTSPPAKFEARKIDYDLLTGSGLAHGPVRFTFYQDSDPNSAIPKTWIPISVTADENAQFIADSTQTIKQVVFNGNVMTTRKSTMPDFVQSDKIHSEKLTVDLDEVEGGSLDLSRLSVTEGRVYVDSQRTKDDHELSRVKLYCTKISYDKIGDVILAEGPGKIEMVNNESSQEDDSDPNNPMTQPCVAVVDNFTEIRWDMAKQNVVADGDQDAMKLAYYPILDGQIQKQMFVYSMRIEIDFLPDAAGVKSVFTDKSIIYEEWNSDMSKRLHHITGQTLEYDVVDGGGWMKISGTPAVPCYLDGARVPEVRVHPVTGEIETSISTTPGILKGR